MISSQDNSQPILSPDQSQLSGVANNANIDDSIKSQELTTPSVGQSAYNSFKLGFISPEIGLNKLSYYISGTNLTNDSKNTEQLAESYNDIISKAPDNFPQKALDWSANILGYALNPFSIVTGEAAGAVVGKGLGIAADFLPESATATLSKPLSEFIGGDALLPKVAGEGGAKRTISLGETGALSAKSGAIGGATMIPQEVSDNYNQDTNSINWGGVVKGTVLNGGIGFLLPAIPFTAGAVWKSVFGRDAALPEVGGTLSESQQSSIDKAVQDGRITKKEADYLNQYHENPDEASLSKQANEIAAKRGLQVDGSGNTIPLQMLNSDDVNSLNNAMWDMAASDGEVSPNDSSSIRDYIAQNRMDDLLGQKNLRDGLSSVIDFMQTKEDMKDAKLKEADDILDKHMMKGVNQNKDFTQEKIYKALKKGNPDSIPYHVPDNISDRIKKEGNGVAEEDLPPILKPKEELQHIKDSLFTEDGLAENYQNKNAYHRLSQLAEVWPQAATLLDRVHLEDAYEKQESYKGVLQSLHEMMQSPLQKLSDPRKVRDYLNQKVESTKPDYKGQRVQPEEKEFSRDEERQENGTKDNLSLDKLEDEVRQTKASNLSEDFRKSKNVFDEFKSKKTIFENLVSCIMG